MGLKPSAMQGEARLRGLYRIIYSKTIRNPLIACRIAGVRLFDRSYHTCSCKRLYHHRDAMNGNLCAPGVSTVRFCSSVISRKDLDVVSFGNAVLLTPYGDSPIIAGAYRRSKEKRICHSIPLFLRWTT